MSTEDKKSAMMLTDEEIRNLSGGVIVNAAGTPEADPYNTWELIDNYNGSILGRFRSKEDAIKFSHDKYGYDNSMDTWEISYDQVLSLRKYGQ